MPLLGEKVLCFHGPLIYEAKALRHQVTKDKQVKYFIHYAGWNKKYVWIFFGIWIHALLMLI